MLMVSCYSQQVACPQIFTTTWFFLREIDKQLFRSILCGEGVWNGCLLERAKGEDVKCRFCGRQDGDGHLFRVGAYISAIFHVREFPNFYVPDGAESK